MPLVGFEPTTPAGERPQTYVLDCAATATCYIFTVKLIVSNNVRNFINLLVIDQYFHFK